MGNLTVIVVLPEKTGAPDGILAVAAADLVHGGIEFRELLIAAVVE